MTTIRTLSIALLFTASTTAGAQSLSILAPDCRAPSPMPTIPDGNTASEADLVAAQKKLKAYLADGEEYMSCLGEAERALGDTVTPEQRAVLLGAYNSTVDVMKGLGEQFNEAVRAFKAR